MLQLVLVPGWVVLLVMAAASLLALQGESCSD
jgi:hypothetical protein